MVLFGEQRLLDSWIQNPVGIVCKRERDLGSLDEGVQKDSKSLESYIPEPRVLCILIFYNWHVPSSLPVPTSSGKNLWRGNSRETPQSVVLGSYFNLFLVLKAVEVRNTDTLTVDMAPYPVNIYCA